MIESLKLVDLIGRSGEFNKENLLGLIFYSSNMERSAEVIKIMNEVQEDFKDIKFWLMDGFIPGEEFAMLREEFALKVDPTVIIYKKGKEIKRLEGFKAKTVIIKALKELN